MVNGLELCCALQHLHSTSKCFTLASHLSIHTLIHTLVGDCCHATLSWFGVLPKNTSACGQSSAVFEPLTLRLSVRNSLCRLGHDPPKELFFPLGIVRAKCKRDKESLLLQLVPSIVLCLAEDALYLDVW